MDFTVSEVDARCTHRHSTIHGPLHWKCVAYTGSVLLKENPDADAAVVLLFGLLHDSMRIDDGFDRDHGRRAGAFAVELNGRFFHLPPAQLKTLQRAYDEHTFGKTTSDPTLAVCWDSDRLNLWRLGVRPLEQFLSTAAARERIEWARGVVEQSFTWPRLYDLFEDLPP
ncbi:MAG TPA: hypothetical protein VEJ63_11460 [Planctomycetota bacterium]|nr:hypothetical protein [Planctomycetota bacterium]